MRPPNSTKSAVYQWNTALLETCHQLGEFSCSELVTALSLVRTATDVTMTNRSTKKPCPFLILHTIYLLL